MPDCQAELDALTAAQANLDDIEDALLVAYEDKDTKYAAIIAAQYAFAAAEVVVNYITDQRDNAQVEVNQAQAAYDSCMNNPQMPAFQGRKG